MSRPVLPLLFVVIVVAALAYFWNTDSVIEFNNTAEQNVLAKTYLINTRSMSYNEQGTLTEIFEAQDVRHFSKQKHSLIIEPRFYSHNGNDQTWSASSERGRFLHNREILSLAGNVVLTTDQSGVHLYTEAMLINLAKKTASSKVPVTLTQGLNTIKAQGMTADLNKERIRMNPNVESVYVPAPS